MSSDYVEVSEYEKATGLPTGRHIVASIRDIAANVAPGCDVFSGRLNYYLDRVLEGIVLHATIEQSAAYNAGPPTEFHRWNRTQMAWVDPRTTGEQLAEAQRARVVAIKAEALTRMGAQFAVLGDPDMVLVLRELYLSVALAARQPTPALTQIMNVYSAAATAITAVKAATTVAQVAAVTVAWPA